MNFALRTGLALLAVAATVATAGAQDKPAPASVPAPGAITPKPLSPTVKKGLEYLVKQQHPNGGWGQGGGWRVGEQGRIEGVDVKDPPDVGDTCIAVLALVRAGNTPLQGPYAKEVERAVDFVCNHVQKSDETSLYVTDARGTQMQSKIGPYVDTFLASLVLAELKGKTDDHGRLATMLTKTVRKIERHQQDDGTFKGNDGWATVLSQGLANKGLNRAAQCGVAVHQTALARIKGQVEANYDAKAGTFKPAQGPGPYGSPDLASKNPQRTVNYNGRGNAQQSQAPAAGRGNSVPAGPSDAGVPIYNASSNLTNAADVANTLRMQEKRAKEVLGDKDAKPEERKKAQDTLKRVAEAETLCDEATRSVLKQLDQPEFAQGYGSNGGEEFLSYMNISEALLLKGGDDWKKWDKLMTESLSRIQDRDGSWSGHHCITGRTFCTATALLVLMADRAPVTAAEKGEALSK
ncbi:MAG: prenyltransferase/squalene oxidase repeat-containing protein [Gemmataceae bacterium]